MLFPMYHWMSLRNMAVSRQKEETDPYTENGIETISMKPFRWLEPTLHWHSFKWDATDSRMSLPFQNAKNNSCDSFNGLYQEFRLDSPKKTNDSAFLLFWNPNFFKGLLQTFSSSNRFFRRFSIHNMAKLPPFVPIQVIPPHGSSPRNFPEGFFGLLRCCP